MIPMTGRLPLRLLALGLGVAVPAALLAQARPDVQGTVDAAYAKYPDAPGR